MSSHAASVVAEPDPLVDRAMEHAATPEDLFKRHMTFVWRNLRRLGVPDASIEDAAQDVFLVVHRRWKSYSSGRAAVEGWLYGIVLHVAHNHRRSIRRRLACFVPWHNSGEHLVARGPTPSDALEQRENLAMFEAAVRRLSERKRAVFLLVDVEQCSVVEAAEALGINQNTAYWRLRAAREEFRKALAWCYTRAKKGWIEP